MPGLTATATTIAFWDPVLTHGYSRVTIAVGTLLSVDDTGDQPVYQVTASTAYTLHYADGDVTIYEISLQHYQSNDAAIVPGNPAQPANGTNKPNPLPSYPMVVFLDVPVLSPVVVHNDTYAVVHPSAPKAVLADGYTPPNPGMPVAMHGNFTPGAATAPKAVLGDGFTPPTPGLPVAMHSNFTPGAATAPPSILPG